MVAFDGGVLVVGTRLVTVPANRDALLMRLGAATPSAEFIGGSSNDQLWAVSQSGAQTVAVGISRSFLAARDTTFFVQLDPSGLSAQYHELPSPVHVQPRAIDATDAGFVVAGRLDGGTQGYLERVSSTLVPEAAARFAFSGALDVRVRQVRAAGSTFVVVGDLTNTGAFLSGFIVGFDAVTLSVRYAFEVSHPTRSVELSDVALLGKGTAVGAVGGDGLLVEFDALTGGGLVTTLVPNTRLSSIAGPAPAVVAGASAGSLVAARLLPSGLSGSAFSDLRNPSNISPTPLLRVGTGALLFGRQPDAGLARLELNEALEAACNGAVTGRPFAALLEPDAGVGVMAAPVALTPITLQVTPISGVSRSAVAVAEAPACWP